jgi:kanamycin kinase
LRPDAGTPVPAPVLALAGGGTVRPVWVNELGGITFEVGAGGRRRFVKWAPAGSGIDLAAEAARLLWDLGP